MKVAEARALAEEVLALVDSLESTEHKTALEELCNSFLNPEEKNLSVGAFLTTLKPALLAAMLDETEKGNLQTASSLQKLKGKTN